MAIVELGAWLGAGTAQLALGLAGQARRAGHSFLDQFRVTPGDFGWASKRGLALELGQDTRAMVGASLAPFGQNVRLHAAVQRAELERRADRPLVDDMTKWPVPFHHALVTFGPSWVPGVTTIVLMDYLYWRKAKPSTSGHCSASGASWRRIANISNRYDRLRDRLDHAASLYTQAFDFGLLPPFDVRGPVAKLLPPALTGAMRRLLQTGRG